MISICEIRAKLIQLREYERASQAVRERLLRQLTHCNECYEYPNGRIEDAWDLEFTILVGEVESATDLTEGELRRFVNRFSIEFLDCEDWASNADVIRLVWSLAESSIRERAAFRALLGELANDLGYTNQQLLGQFCELTLWRQADDLDKGIAEWIQLQNRRRKLDWLWDSPGST